MAVRILDIDTTSVNRKVPAATLEAVDAIHSHYGHAGPAFVECLINERLTSGETLRLQIMEQARKIAGKQADSARLRAAIPLAILYVAGLLAKRFGLLDETVPVAKAVTWAWDQSTQSANSRVLSAHDQAIANLRRGVLERLNVTIKRISPAYYHSRDLQQPVNNREAMGWYDDDAVYLPIERAREAAGSGISERALTQLFTSRDLLAKRHDRRRVHIRSVPGVGKIDVYALKRSEFAPGSTIGL
jgi:hypothetical protein